MSHVAVRIGTVGTSPSPVSWTYAAQANAVIDGTASAKGARSKLSQLIQVSSSQS